MLPVIQQIACAGLEPSQMRDAATLPWFYTCLVVEHTVEHISDNLVGKCKPTKYSKTVRLIYVDFSFSFSVSLSLSLSLYVLFVAPTAILVSSSHQRGPWPQVLGQWDAWSECVMTSDDGFWYGFTIVATFDRSILFILRIVVDSCFLFLVK